MSEAKREKLEVIVGLIPTQGYTKSSKPTPFNMGGKLFPLRVRKDLIDAKEKAKIVASILKRPSLSSEVFAREFKRLPATIRKFAAEVGIHLA